MFADLLEAWDVLNEKRSKEQQLRGLMRTTGHIGSTYHRGGIEKLRRPSSRDRPLNMPGANKRVMARFRARKKESYREKERASSAELAREVKVPYSPRKQNLAGVSVARLRGVRDEPSERKQKKAAAARRLPISFPKDK